MVTAKLWAVRVLLVLFCLLSIAGVFILLHVAGEIDSGGKHESKIGVDIGTPACVTRDVARIRPC